MQLSGALTIGDYLYQSRPVATITRDNSQEIIALDKIVYLKNFKIGGMPQQAICWFKYNAPKYWYAGINFNYFSDIYLSLAQIEELLKLFQVTLRASPILMK